mmetsp:Transcript_66500/g.131163  ORF Transcript_66500/g.131163 Transcript_66500/m.131163 type:complete len:98 (-) Transcript_66500:1451-1744(-)
MSVAHVFLPQLLSTAIVLRQQKRAQEMFYGMSPSRDEERLSPHRTTGPCCLPRVAEQTYGASKWHDAGSRESPRPQSVFWYAAETLAEEASSSNSSQ